MKKVKLLFVLLIVLLFSGCAELITNTRNVDTTQTFQLNVDSSPQDAVVFLNEKFVGRTPVKFPLVTKSICQEGVLVSYSHCWPTEQYTLKVTKEGYDDAVEMIEYEWKTDQSRHITDEEPNKTDYFFKLKQLAKKQENISSPTGTSEEIRKYKKLMDDGIITKEEFEQKKKQFLGF